MKTRSSRSLSVSRGACSARRASSAANRSRRAFSLLEVIVALAIFLMSIVVLGQLVTMGGERALDIDHEGEAALLAQSKMAEVIWGAVPLQSTSDQSFDEAPDYKWSLTADQNSTVANLWNVTVTVSRNRGDGSNVESVLSQMILDPSVRGSSQDTITISGTPSTGGGTGGTAAGGQSGSQQQASAQGGAAAASQQKGATSAGGVGTRTPASGGGTTPRTTMPSSSTPRTTTPSSSAPKSSAPASSSPKGGGK